MTLPMKVDTNAVVKLFVQRWTEKLQLKQMTEDEVKKEAKQGFGIDVPACTSVCDFLREMSVEQ